MKLKKMESVDVIFVLCSMTYPRQKVTAKVLTRMHRDLGYSACAVHYVIERDGSIVKTRQNDIPGFFADEYNSRSIQVCLIGGIDERGAYVNNFTKEQLMALDTLRVALPRVPTVYDYKTMPKEFL